MESLTTLLALAALIVVVAFIIQPFVAAARRDEAGGGGRRAAGVLRQRAELLAERNRIYAAIRDLDFDYKTNKIADDEYAQQRYVLVAQGVDVLERLDALPALDESPEDDPIEQVVLSLQGGGAEAAEPAAGGPPAGAAGFCPQCGAPAQAGDRFCTSCGAALQAAEPEAAGAKKKSG